MFCRSTVAIAGQLRNAWLAIEVTLPASVTFLKAEFCLNAPVVAIFTFLSDMLVKLVLPDMIDGVSELATLEGIVKFLILRLVVASKIEPELMHLHPPLNVNDVKLVQL